MFYKFNNIIGRIAPSTQAQAYSPQGLTPLSRPPSVITFDSKKTRPVHEPVPEMTRPASSVSQSQGSVPQGSVPQGLGVVPNSPRYQKVMQLQSTFLKHDGKLVWQKLGARDRASYYFTLALIVTGGIACVTQLITMMNPPKEE